MLAVVAAVCAGWALHAKNEARERFLDATAQRLRATSQASLSGQSPKGKDPITQLTFSADGHTPATWGGDPTLQLWNTETSQRIGDLTTTMR